MDTQIKGRVALVTGASQGNGVLPVIRVARAVLPGMARRGWGRIVNISSEGGVQPDPIEYGAAMADP